jgi:uncharacterized protein DUF3141
MSPNLRKCDQSRSKDGAGAITRPYTSGCALRRALLRKPKSNTRMNGRDGLMVSTASPKNPPQSERRHDVNLPNVWSSSFDWAKAFGVDTFSGMQFARHAIEYGIDAWQRSMLLLDVLRQRGNNYLERTAQQVPHVLHFQFEPVMDGRALTRPVNYGLVRVIPPPGTTLDPRKRPFIVFDPRAGHGPGIGGMKSDSEIGVALKEGHPCYFVGFTPTPMPGQTVGDVCRAEVLFIEKVIALHPDADGKPVLIGNCQAGWQIFITSAIRPDLVGPIMVAGSPLSYWAGVRGKNPMRYLGGMLGGTWLTALLGDLGNGIFDGAYLVNNFEGLDPANTYWKKIYNVYSKIDTEPPRFLEFEKWWGSPVLLNAAEMQTIADELFVGNKLTSGELYNAEGIRIDLRNIRSPIIVFCSWGDNITPPQQALGWILDLYDRDEEIVANGQTIIYALHQSVGHLGIFVSGKVATKEHGEFAQTMDLIDVLPPGLYEAVMTERGTETDHAELVAGDYVVRFERRTLSHIRALGGNDADDDRRFATVARISDVNLGLYRAFLSPIVRMMANEQTAEWMRRMHPMRCRFEAFSDQNPWARSIAQLAQTVRANRSPASDDNPFLTVERTVSQQMIDALNGYRDARDQFVEALFMGIYGSPLLQAVVGLRSDAATARPRIGRDLAHEVAASKARAALDAQMAQGGVMEGTLRAMGYIGLGRPVKGVDERAFNLLRHMRESRTESTRMSMTHFKEAVREQALALQISEERAVASLPQLLARGTAEELRGALDLIRRITQIGGAPTGEVKDRLERVAAMFDSAISSMTARPPRKAAAADSRAPVRRRAPRKSDVGQRTKRPPRAPRG